MANLAKIHVSIANNPGEFNANLRHATYEEMFDVSATYLRIFKKKVWGYHHSVKQFGSRSAPTLSGLVLVL